MLTILRKEHLDQLESAYPHLIQFDRQYVLYQNENFVYLPRHFNIAFPIKEYIIFKDPQFKEKTIDINFKGQLRDYQQDGMKFLVDKYNTDGYITGIFEARVALIILALIKSP